MESDRIQPLALSEQRAKAIRSFEAWLDRALADESAPEGLTAELLASLESGEPLAPLEGAEWLDEEAGRGCDLYSLWAAMAALTQEVRLERRSFHQLKEALLPDGLDGHQSGQPNRQTTDGPSASEEPMKGQARPQEIDLLLDLRDRMERGINAVRSASKELAPAKLPRMARWLGGVREYAFKTQETLTALSHSYSLTLDRLDEALVTRGVDRIACLNREFDPRRMTAIDIEETDDQPEGTVVAVYRDGYEWNGMVHRTAQVKVARRKTGGAQ